MSEHEPSATTAAKARTKDKRVGVPGVMREKLACSGPFAIRADLPHAVHICLGACARCWHKMTHIRHRSRGTLIRGCAPVFSGLEMPR